MAKKRNRKAAIIGYTVHKNQAPWGDPEWDLFGLNDAYRQPEWQAVLGDRVHQAAGRVVWFQLHHQEADGTFRYGASDPNHLEVMARMPVRVVCWQPHPRIPNSEAYPEAQVYDLFPRKYFNNSISWMIAWAVANDYQEIGVYGVDMALDAITNAEYAHQRPSCEYFIGWCEARGITVHIPEQSDLCKTVGLYGKDDTTAFRKKLLQRHEELIARENQMREECRVRALHLANCEGARQNTEYILRTWAPGDGVLEVVGAADPVTLRRHEVLSGVLPDGPPAMRPELAKAIQASDGDGKG